MSDETPIKLLIDVAPSRMPMLERIAHKQGLTTRAFLENLVDKLTETSGGIENDIAVLYAQGLPDAYIASVLGVTNAVVATRRRAFGPANPFNRYIPKEGKNQ